ncbi:MAG: CpsD/CapB family tyrosine-protein kinase [Candidatus Eiseniibacteriota bacterium]|jgi:capsular exopolysaccharide synthesis family protein
MAKTQRNIFEYFEDESPAGTEFRRLHVRLLRQADSQPLKTVQFTSSRRGEGKSTTSTHLALSVARHTEGKVLLVDLDLRKPRVHEIYGLPQAKGMTDFMRGVLPMAAVLKETEQPNLKVITSGRVISGPSKLFEEQVLRRTLQQLSDAFDLCIIDSPPLLPVSDPLLLAPRVDGVVLVVLAGRTPRQVVRRSRELLSDVEANVLGAVVNNAQEALPYYYDYKYYGYEEEVPRVRAPRGERRGEVKLVSQREALSP